MQFDGLLKNIKKSAADGCGDFQDVRKVKKLIGRLAAEVVHFGEI